MTSAGFLTPSLPLSVPNLRNFPSSGRELAYPLPLGLGVIHAHALPRSFRVNGVNATRRSLQIENWRGEEAKTAPNIESVGEKRRKILLFCKCSSPRYHQKVNSNRARPYLRLCFHFVDHWSAKIYGNQKSPQNNKQHTVDFPFFFGGEFLIAIIKDIFTSSTSRQAT